MMPMSAGRVGDKSPVGANWDAVIRKTAGRTRSSIERAEMEPDPSLPSFARPPLGEVAAGMQFAAMPMKAVDIGALYSLIADEYPKSQDVPLLPPAFETFGPIAVPELPLSISMGLPMPRSWFVSHDDEHLIQLQPDRLIVNWRMQASGKAYPRYPEVRRRFVAAYNALERLRSQKSYPALASNQCSLDYFNKIALPEGAEWTDLHHLLRGMELTTGPEWRGRFSDEHLALRAELKRSDGAPFARLHVECTPILIDLGTKGWALNLTVRGRPETPEFSSVLDFLDIAHVQIVTCFTAITTEPMHELWERQQ